MTYKDLVPLIMGVNNHFTDTSMDNVPEYGVKFIEKIYSIVDRQKHGIKDTFGIIISRQEYDIPYNYLLGKITSRTGEINQDDLDVILTQLELKVQYDLSLFLSETLKMKAMYLGDNDIDL